jgi:hypothetical protein
MPPVSPTALFARWKRSAKGFTQKSLRLRIQWTISLLLFALNRSRRKRAPVMNSRKVRKSPARAERIRMLILQD